MWRSVERIGHCASLSQCFAGRTVGSRRSRNGPAAAQPSHKDWITTGGKLSNPRYFSAEADRHNRGQAAQGSVGQPPQRLPGSAASIRSRRPLPSNTGSCTPSRSAPGPATLWRAPVGDGPEVHRRVSESRLYLRSLPGRTGDATLRETGGINRAGDGHNPQPGALHAPTASFLCATTHS